MCTHTCIVLTYPYTIPTTHLYHICITSISHLYHIYITSISHLYHIYITSISHLYHIYITCVSCLVLKELGCFIDGGDRDLDGIFVTEEDQMTPENCVNYCRKNSFRYAGVQVLHWQYHTIQYDTI